MTDKIDILTKYACMAAEVAYDSEEKIDEWHDFWTDTIETIGDEWLPGDLNKLYAKSLFNRVARDEYSRLTAPKMEETNDDN